MSKLKLREESTVHGVKGATGKWVLGLTLNPVFCYIALCSVTLPPLPAIQTLTVLTLALLDLNCWGYAASWPQNLHYLIYSSWPSSVVGIMISSTSPGRKLRLDGLQNLAKNIQLMRGTLSTVSCSLA